jgi:tetratricopeptide (TPR) repeat protein
MRLNPHNPAGITFDLGRAQFCMGNLEEAVTLIEKACRLNPEIWGWNIWLSSIYGLLGREKEARNALEIYRKGAGGIPNLPAYMYWCPFKDRVVADRYAEGLIKAGIKAPPWRYFPTFKENQLTGEEIKKLLFGARNTGFAWDGQQWWIDRKRNGEFTWRGSGPISSDTGKSRIEGDMLCTQHQKNFWGLEFCGTVFRNPQGKYESKDEYFSCNDWGFSAFSLLK